MRVEMLRSNGRVEVINSGRLANILYQTNKKYNAEGKGHKMTTAQCKAVADGYLAKGGDYIFCGRLFSIII